MTYNISYALPVKYLFSGCFISLNQYWTHLAALFTNSGNPPKSPRTMSFGVYDGTFSRSLQACICTFSTALYGSKPHSSEPYNGKGTICASKSMKKSPGEKQFNLLRIFRISIVPRFARVKCSPSVATLKLTRVERVSPR